jgi:uncharacterized phiE125 gp8 family phage protein
VLAPTEEPVSLEEAKAHCRVDIDDDDSLIEDLITAARDLVETETRRSLVTTYWAMSIDDFPSCGARRIALPRPPLQSVQSITYYDSDGAQQTLSTDVYGVNTAREPGFVYLKYGQVWPCTYEMPDAVTINFVAGWDDVLYVPSGIKHAIKLLVAHWYEHREAVAEKPGGELPLGICRLIWNHKLAEAI